MHTSLDICLLRVQNDGLSHTKKSFGCLRVRVGGSPHTGDCICRFRVHRRGSPHTSIYNSVLRVHAGWFTHTGKVLCVRISGSGRREESPSGSSSPDRRPQAARPVSRDAGALREASARGRICAAMTNLPARPARPSAAVRNQGALAGRNQLPPMAASGG